jgi:CheY-like chemotaxis protein
MPKLHVKHPEMGELTFAITGDRVSVGRRPDNSIQINHGTVSGHHGEFVAVNGHYVFRDLESTNHTFVNGAQISDADLTAACRLTIGTVECHYVPDPPLASLASPVSGDPSQLRKVISGLRQQNDDLVAKLADQQHQIDILGSAHLLTPAAGADMISLREQVRALSGERDRLVRDNGSLRAELERLRGIVALGGDPAARKATSPVAIARGSDGSQPPVVVTPDGSASIAAPTAKVAESSPSWLGPVEALNGNLKPLLTHLVCQPGDATARAELGRIATEMAQHVGTLGGHLVARLASGIESVARDAVSRPGELDAGLLRTLSQGSDLIFAISQPEFLHRCNGLPPPSILAVDDDHDLLHGIVTSLEFAQLRATACSNASEALSFLESQNFDIVLLDVGMPDIDGIEACASIRNLSKHARTPIVFLTGQDNLAMRERSASNGGTDFIGKPFSMFELTLKAMVWASRNQLNLV